MRVTGKIIGYYADDGAPLIEELLSEAFGDYADDRLKDLVEQGSVIPCGELPDSPKSLEAWEESCDGLYPGYATETGTEQEARAYAALTEVLDEAAPSDIIGCVQMRGWTSSDETYAYFTYYHDQRITNLAMLLLQHGWTPPEHYAYAPMTTQVAPKSMSPLDLEEMDYGQIMKELGHPDP